MYIKIVTIRSAETTVTAILTNKSDSGEERFGVGLGVLDAEL